jgi:hypothetical protein
MKNILILIVLFASFSHSADNVDKKKRLEKQIQKEMQNEKKYAQEQKFYTEENYDFKGAEVNKESLKSIDVIESDPEMESSDFMDMPN